MPSRIDITEDYDNFWEGGWSVGAIAILGPNHLEQQNSTGETLVLRIQL